MYPVDKRVTDEPRSLQDYQQHDVFFPLADTLAGLSRPIRGARPTKGRPGSWCRSDGGHNGGTQRRRPLVLDLCDNEPRANNAVPVVLCFGSGTNCFSTLGRGAARSSFNTPVMGWSSSPDVNRPLSV
ncbi:hypothetical protein GWI33_001268 [Rhynchophorus ferrugineus]|uniref:Uncharacterized protein n=1 Tax=Rhynchophorus ferrugineus TaxID=354439 RepID=A0A834ISF6_RHYFE|nr:hypothetical protein GWI33_001268 [Rhynchophorus ferrugineus]